MGCCGLVSRVEGPRVNGRVLAQPGLSDDFDGPLRNRSCRDVVFLILFIACVVGAIVYLAYAGINGDPARLINGHDAYGNVCGKDNPKYFDLAQSGKDFTSKPFLHVGLQMEVDPVAIANGADPGSITSNSTCVASCPASTTPLGYYCLPLRLDDVGNRSDAVLKAITGTTGTDFFRDVANDIRGAWREIVYMCLIALVLSVVLAVMLRFLAPVIVWVTVVVIVVASVAVTIFLWVSWSQRKTAVEDAKSGERQLSSYELKVMEKSVTNFLVAAIFATIFAVLTIVLLIAMRKRIKLVIALFKEAGKAIGSMPLLLLQPAWTCFWLVAVVTAGAGGVILIESSGDAQLFRGTVVFVKSDLVAHLRWYHLFALLWVTQFLVACQHVTIAGAVAQWYFTRDKTRLGWPIARAMSNMYRYHLGSIALGSLIIAIVKFIRIIFKYLEKRLSNGNQACSWALKCCQCCLWCFEKFLKFLSKNAYIQIAIYGYGFCKAAQKAFSVLVNNAFRVAAINYVGSFVLFLTKATVVIATVFIGIEIMKSRPEIVYPWVPILLASIFAYFIAHCFIAVYEMTIDTLFLSFCEDCERNDGIEKPYYMSKGLMRFVENSKKAIEALEERQQQQTAWTTNVEPVKATPMHVTPARADTPAFTSPRSHTPRPNSSQALSPRAFSPQPPPSPATYNPAVG